MKAPICWCLLVALAACGTPAPPDPRATVTAGLKTDLGRLVLEAIGLEGKAKQ